MFNTLEIENSGPGKFTSFVLHIAAIALVIGLSASIHKIGKAHFSETLIFPQEVPPPQPLILKIRPTVVHGSGHSLGSPVLVTAGAPVISPVRHEAAQPMLVKLDMPSTVELPQTNMYTVVMAPQARVAGFGGTVAAGGPGPRGLVSGAGFGQGVGTGSGRGTGRVVKTGFEITREQAHAVIRKVPDTLAAVVYSIPRAHYTETARAAHVTGDVILKVRFTASGTVEVLDAIQSPGYGLEDAARSVASGIMFKPAMQDGKPVDSEHVVTVQFQSANPFVVWTPQG